MKGKALHPIGLGLKFCQLHGQRDKLIQPPAIINQEVDTYNVCLTIGPAGQRL